ncbi:MAG: Crp/Fnr family transcriptional regulator [Sulfuritalea sp.]|nr:Crp/Fnr family transcriptional regulator [Sulfuritalea sp.]
MPDNSNPSSTLVAAIAQSRWAQRLKPEELERARQGMTERRVEAGCFICRQGEQPACWIGIIDGLAKMSSDWVTGKTASYAGIPAGGWFGEGSLLKTEPRRYDVVALRATRVACMKRETFRWLLDHSIAFNHAIIEQINERLGQFIGLLESQRLHDTDTRVARSISIMFNPVLYPGQNATLAISQEEIGHLAGVSRQRANRSLKLLEDAGFLRVEYGGIAILDLDGLRRFGG